MDVAVGFLSCCCAHILQMRTAVDFPHGKFNKLINIDP